jgi:hypothetical protein
MIINFDTQLDTQQGFDAVSNTCLTLVVTNVVHVSVNSRIYSVCKSSVNVNDLHFWVQTFDTLHC